LVKQVDQIPEVEWWDEFLLPPGEARFTGNIYEERITSYVQHPVPLVNQKMENV
jgi:hypothetical protein